MYKKSNKLPSLGPPSEVSMEPNGDSHIFPDQILGIGAAFFLLVPHTHITFCIILPSLYHSFLHISVTLGILLVEYLATFKQKIITRLPIIGEGNVSCTFNLLRRRVEGPTSNSASKRRVGRYDCSSINSSFPLR